jgi:hypothetical protein
MEPEKNINNFDGAGNGGQPDNFDVGQPGEIKKEPTEPVAQIGAELSAREGAGAELKSGEVHAETPIPFDLSKLDRTQLQALKAMLEATPVGVSRKRGNPIVTLRKIDGKIAIDFKRAYLGLVKDHELNREVERHIIPIKFFGDKEFTNMLYKTFIESERVNCEVLDYRQKVEEFEEGQTYSRETGQLVEMVRKEVRTWFNIKLPNGEVVEIEGRIANA